MDALTLEELEMLRHETNFFFTRDQAIPVGSPTHQGNGGLEDENNTAGGIGADGSADLDNGLEVLIEFFTPGRDDKEIPVEKFSQKLRAQLVDPLERMIHNATSTAARPSRPPSPPPGWEQGERMPCQGRRPAERMDDASPTFAKVREIYNRRNAADARWAEERHQAMAKRAALNAFRAAEQGRERKFAALNRKELHALRMQETEDRKAALDDDMRQRTEQHELKIAQSLWQASEQAAEAVEATRDKATMMLAKWHRGVVRSESYLQEKDRCIIEEAERKWGQYTTRLWRIGMERHERQESITRQSGMLRVRIQNSFVATLAQRRREHSASQAEALEERQQGAAERRAKVHARYNLEERAFGPKSRAFDAKHQRATSDRGDKSWHRPLRSHSEPTL